MENLDELLDELRLSHKCAVRRKISDSQLHCRADRLEVKASRRLSEFSDCEVTSFLSQPQFYTTEVFVSTPVSAGPGLRHNIEALDRMLSTLDEQPLRVDISHHSSSTAPNVITTTTSYCSPKDNYDTRPHDLSSLPLNSHFDSKTAVENATHQLDELLMSMSHLKYSTPNHDIMEDSEPIKVNETPDTNYKSRVLSLQNGSHTTLGVESESYGIPAEVPKQDNPSIIKKLCLSCHQPLSGKVVTALGGAWHSDHFACNVCHLNLVHLDFFEEAGRPYCSECHQNLFAPRCAYCEEPIKDRCLAAMDAFWHPEHFVCQACLSPFEDNTTAHEHDGRPYCMSCYASQNCTRCESCAQPILGPFTAAMDRIYHADCFTCKDCSVKLTQHNFYAVNHEAYCETHYCLRKGLFCAACSEPIVGRCINALGKRYHVQHFNCTYCLRQLNTGTFKERSGKTYCHACFAQLFG